MAIPTDHSTNTIGTTGNAIINIAGRLVPENLCQVSSVFAFPTTIVTDDVLSITSIAVGTVIFYKTTSVNNISLGFSQSGGAMGAKPGQIITCYTLGGLTSMRWGSQTITGPTTPSIPAYGHFHMVYDSTSDRWQVFV
jgi:hypothetical protein